MIWLKSGSSQAMTILAFGVAQFGSSSSHIQLAGGCVWQPVVQQYFYTSGEALGKGVPMPPRTISVAECACPGSERGRCTQ